jgi:hypothetical protein
MTDQTRDIVERVARAICWKMSEEIDDCSSVCMNARRCMTEQVDPCFVRDAKAAIEAAGVEALTKRVAELEAYRTMDASGSPEAAEVMAWNWISELAQQQRADDAALLLIQSTPVEGGGKVTRLYRSTTLLAVSTTFRDDMNCTVLVRWVAPELRAALSNAARGEEV